MHLVDAFNQSDLFFFVVNHLKIYFIEYLKQ